MIQIINEIEFQIQEDGMARASTESLKDAENSSEPSSVLIARVRSADTSKTPPVRAGGHLYSLSLGNLTNDQAGLWGGPGRPPRPGFTRLPLYWNGTDGKPGRQNKRQYVYGMALGSGHNFS